MWGFAKSGDRSITLDSWDELRRVWADPEAVVWVDLESPQLTDLTEIGEIAGLDDLVLAECLTGEPRPRLEDYGDYLLVVAYGAFLSAEGADDLEPRKLVMFRGERFLVTVHSEPSRSVTGLASRCRRNAAGVIGMGVDQMLYGLIDGMVDRYLMLLDAYEDEVEDFEEQSFDPDNDDDFLQEAARIRRHLIEVRRLIGGQRGLLQPLAEGEYDYLSPGLGKRFTQVRSHLLHAHDRVVGLKERLTAAIQNYNAAVAMRTNEVVRTLTVLTAVMLPMSLIAGVYGMNVPVWPRGEDPASFWEVLALMGSTGVGSFVLFKKLRWI